MGKGTTGWPPRGMAPALARGRSPVISTATLLGALLVTSLAGTASAHAAGSAHPDEWDRLLVIVLVLGAIVATVVFSIMGLALWRYRESSPYVRKEPQTHNARLETIWTIIPVIMVTVIVILSLQVLSTTEDLPEDGLRIEVIGKQFEWVFVYPDNSSTLRDVWVEEGQTVIFEIRSTDVIHSFFLPDFKLKVDAFPNYVDEAYIMAEPAGDYDIYCAEFCGDIHSEMLGTLHIFPKGLSDKPYGPPPGEVPPPPLVEHVTVDIELREDLGTSFESPWSITPREIDVPVDAEVTLRVWNNGTATHGLAISAPYDLTLSEVPAGEMRYLNFTADLPTSRAVVYCPDDDHEARGMRGALVVVVESQEPSVGSEGGGWPSIYTMYLMAFALLGAVLFMALRGPREEVGDEGEGPSDEGAPEGGGKGEGP